MDCRHTIDFRDYVEGLSKHLQQVEGATLKGFLRTQRRRRRLCVCVYVCVDGAAAIGDKHDRSHSTVALEYDIVFVSVQF